MKAPVALGWLIIVVAGALSVLALGQALVGPGVDAHRDSLREALPDAYLGSAALTRPSGATVARLGRERYAREEADELYDVEPLYAQGPPVTPVNHNPQAAA